MLIKMNLEQSIKHLEEELKIKEDWSCVACKEDHEQLLSWLKELQAIKESNPSEALKDLENLSYFKSIYDTELYVLDTEEFTNIKQALVKAQEQEKMLKIIFEKNVDILELRLLIKHHNDRMALKLYNRQYKKEWQLTEEEFNTLKEMVK